MPKSTNHSTRPPAADNCQVALPSVHPEAANSPRLPHSGAGWLYRTSQYVWLAARRLDHLGRSFPRSRSDHADRLRPIVAPADGLVTMISRVTAPLELAGGRSPGVYAFDFHRRVRRSINRSPIAGTVRRIAYVLANS
jgi:hypothetical protein